MNHNSQANQNLTQMINNEKEHHTNKRKFQTPHIPDGKDTQNLNINKHDNRKDRIH